MSVSGRVRPAGRGDLDALVSLWCALLDHHARLDPTFARRAGSEGAVRALLADWLDEDRTGIWVAEGEGATPCALCVARLRRAPPLLAERASGEIEDLYVTPRARRAGLGRALAECAAAWLRERGARRIEVRVSARNPDGRAFWEKLGFARFVDVLDRRG